MFFTIGIETPKNDNEAYGIIVPALSNDDYCCVSAADSERDIPSMAKEAILLVIEDMIESGKWNLDNIKNNHLSYQKDKSFSDYDTWLLIDVDLSIFDGKPKRINISLPDTLIQRIDDRVKDNPTYKDRSHFLAEAAKHELANNKGA